MSAMAAALQMFEGAPLPDFARRAAVNWMVGGARRRQTSDNGPSGRRSVAVRRGVGGYNRQPDIGHIGRGAEQRGHRQLGYQRLLGRGNDPGLRRTADGTELGIELHRQHAPDSDAVLGELPCAVTFVAAADQLHLLITQHLEDVCGV